MDEFPMFATNKTSNMTSIFSRLAGGALVAMLAVTSAPVLAQEDNNAPIEERMTPTERRATGINKLTPQELEALNAWLADQDIIVIEQAPAEPADRRGFRERIANVFADDGEDNSVITSRLVGTFDGWDGETVFELENGMVWRQAESNLYTVRPINNPEVVIRRGLFDRWRLQVKGYNKRLTVERVK